MKEVPVYLFLGFLDAGKTKFIQETFEDPRFDEERARTLLLVCEEGEVEYDPSRFAVRQFAVETVGEDGLTEANLAALAKKHRAEKVVVEWNGMLTLDKLFGAMPEGWLIAQVMTFFDSPMFLAYNRNMRQLVYDKLQYADLVVFNRFEAHFSKEEFHKIVRAASRRPQIVYEYANGEVEYDDIADPLPFDIDADPVVIEDRDYAYFYRDLLEETPKYDGKRVRFKGLVAADKRLGRGTVVVGRHVMTCCEADIAYSGLVLKHNPKLSFRTRDWVTVTARIRVCYHPVYGQEGPVLEAEEIVPASPPDQEVATFF